MGSSLLLLPKLDVYEAAQSLVILYKLNHLNHLNLAKEMAVVNSILSVIAKDTDIISWRDGVMNESQVVTPDVSLFVLPNFFPDQSKTAMAAQSMFLIYHFT